MIAWREIGWPMAVKALARFVAPPTIALALSMGKGEEEVLSMQVSDSITCDLAQDALASNLDHLPLNKVASVNEALGERIRQARKWAGMGQIEVAEAVGVSRAAISNWELGQGMKRQNLVSVSDALGVSPEWLISGDPALAPRGVSVLEGRGGRPVKSESVLDEVHLIRLMAAAFEFLGKPQGQAQELAKAILTACRTLQAVQGDGPVEDPTRQLAAFLLRMYASS